MADRPTSLRADLIKALARLEANRREVADGRRQLVQRAEEQLDSMPGTVHHVETHVQAGMGGGILAQRRLRTLLTERGRLLRVVADHGPKVRGDEPDDVDDDT